VYTRATGGGPFCLDDADRDRVVERLHRVSRRFKWRICAYTVMTTHYHLVLETRAPNLSPGMQQINSVCARRFNDRWNRYGTLVSCRFGYRIIEDEDYLFEVCRYVLLNPVRAGLCRRAADWRWSGGRILRAASDL
jgi:putative transposase